MPPFLFWSGVLHFALPMTKIATFKLLPKPQDDDATDLPKFKWIEEEIWHRTRLIFDCAGQAYGSEIARS